MQLPLSYWDGCVSSDGGGRAITSLFYLFILEVIN
jgi:hypothetical protein